jgi:hypothetical protein
MRLEAQKKLGFYPAPPPVIALIASHLQADPQAVALDPCAGEGEAIHQLTRGLGIPETRVLAIELDEARGNATRERLAGGRVLAPANFLATATTPGCVSLAYVNPPFDHEATGGRREETSFLIQVSRLLKPRGILVAILPERTATRDEVTRHIETYYEEVELFKFPNPHRSYAEVVIFARRRRGFVMPEPHSDSFIVQARQPWLWKTVGAIPGAQSTWEVPAGDLPRRFEKIGPTHAELLAMLNDSDLARAIFGEPPPVSPPQPGLPVRKGQLILTLVAGGLDGPVRRLGGEAPHIIRGSTHKIEIPTDSEPILNEKGKEVGTRTVIKQEPVMTIRAVGVAFDRIYDFSSNAQTTEAR